MRIYSLLHKLTIAMLAAVVLLELYTALVPVLPFWIDEWRIIYNLKFRSAAELTGPLLFTQQFPRVPLLLQKAIGDGLGYSYTSLRLPACLLSIASIALSWQVMRRIYPATARNPLRYLFLIIIVTSPPFLFYFAQVKQYAAELFLSILGLWQLLETGRIQRTGKVPWSRWAVLAVSLAAAPFFSYTYPIVVAPVFLLTAVFIATRFAATRRADTGMAQQAILLAIGAVAILVFYRLDVSQAVGDSAMRCFWGGQMFLPPYRTPLQIAICLWNFFAIPGHGLVFQIIYAVLGTAATAFALSRITYRYRTPTQPHGSDMGTMHLLLLRYALLLLGIVLLLFLTGALPLGEPRLNGFAIPALAILLVDLLSHGVAGKYRKAWSGVAALLFAGIFGNIVSTVLNVVSNEDAQSRRFIYRETDRAIRYAQAHHFPLLVNDGIVFPFNLPGESLCLEPIGVVQILKTWPAYRRDLVLPVFVTETHELPATDTFVVGDGRKYRLQAGEAVISDL